MMFKLLIRVTLFTLILIVIVGCYGTVEPYWEDARYPRTVISDEDFIHITPGSLPKIGVTGFLEIGKQDIKDMPNSADLKEGSDSNIIDLLESLKKHIYRDSGIETVVLNQAVKSFIEINQANSETKYSGNSKKSFLPDTLPQTSDKQKLHDKNYTHLVLVHGVVEKEIIDKSVFLADGGVAPAIGLVTNRPYHFTVSAYVYEINSGQATSRLELTDQGESVGIWTVLLYPAAIRAVSIERYMKAFGARLGEEIARRWVVE